MLKVVFTQRASNLWRQCRAQAAGDCAFLLALRCQRRELAARIFRRVHTLKGSAGSLGLKSVSQIAHDFEGVLDGVRLGRVEINDAVLDLFEDGTDAIARALESGPNEETSPGTNAVIRRLAALAAQSKKEGTIAGSLIHKYTTAGCEQIRSN